jgi:hypothetical protein
MTEVSEQIVLQTASSNLLAMPAVEIAVITGNNEDWIDSVLFLVDDGSGNTAGMPQLDLTGIKFDMELRATVEDHEVVIRASTADGTLRVGDPPNFGYLLIGIEHETMKMVAAGTYVGDIVGTDAMSVRRVVAIDLQVVEGITRP